MHGEWDGATAQPLTSGLHTVRNTFAVRAALVCSNLLHQPKLGHWSLSGLFRETEPARCVMCTQRSNAMGSFMPLWRLASPEFVKGRLGQTRNSGTSWWFSLESEIHRARRQSGRSLSGLIPVCSCWMSSASSAPRLGHWRQKKTWRTNQMLLPRSWGLQQVCLFVCLTHDVQGFQFYWVGEIGGKIHLPYLCRSRNVF